MTAHFTTSECDGDETFTLAEMLSINDNGEPDGGEFCEWLRTAKVGDRYRDIVTVTRIE